MQICYKSNDIKNADSCVVLGNFDGVHTGHRYLISEAVRCARTNSLRMIIYTFSKHPKQILLRENDFKCITLPDEKREILSSLGADILCMDNFEEIKDFDCNTFCREILINRLGAKYVFCGENFKFGAGGNGDASCLSGILSHSGSKAVVCSPLYEGREPVSSTRIRLMIENGDMQGAANLMGRRFAIRFPVVHGAHIGTAIGIPTINQLFPKEKIVPQKGVYASLVTIGQKKLISVANVGTKPTVSYNETNPPVICETHIIDYHDDLYGQSIKVEFIKKLRGEKKFESLDELVNEVKKNIEEAKKCSEVYREN